MTVLLSESYRHFCDDGTPPAEKVIVCAGPPHLRSLWVNKWQVKQRVYSFFFFFFFRFSSAPASWWEGWNSHSGWTLTCSLVSCHRQREQEVRGWWAAGAAGDLWSPTKRLHQISQLTAEAHWLIGVLRDFKPLTSTLIAAISNFTHWPCLDFPKRRHHPLRDIGQEIGSISCHLITQYCLSFCHWHN